MPVYICLLRGVNVTGANLIKMEDLRTLCAKLKFEKPQTFIQSGNIVFRSAEKNESTICTRIGDAIEKKYGFRPAVMLRTAGELRAVVAGNPFRKRNDIHPGKLLVHFFSSAPAAEVKAKLAEAEKKEELHFVGRELYIYFPDGIGRSDFRSVIDRALKKTVTARNWNSVTRMLAMAEALENGTN